MSRRLTALVLPALAVALTVLGTACNDQAPVTPAPEPAVASPEAAPPAPEVDPTPPVPAPAGALAAASSAVAAEAAGKVAARPATPAPAAAVAAPMPPAAPAVPGVPATGEAPAAPATPPPASAVAPPQPPAAAERDPRGRLVTDPEQGSPDWVIQQVLRAAMNPDPEAGWSILEPLMHSMHRTPNGMQSYRAFNYPASRRKVRLFLADDTKPWFHVVKVETPDPDVLKIFVYNDKSMPTPCAVKKDAEAGGQWRVYRCSL